MKRLPCFLDTCHNVKGTELKNPGLNFTKKSTQTLALTLIQTPTPDLNPNPGLLLAQNVT